MHKYNILTNGNSKQDAMGGMRMTIMKINIEFVAANALVELYENSEKKYVSFDDLLNYGIIIQQILKENNIESVLLLSDYYMIQFVHNYSDMFEIIDDNIYIKEGVDCEQIRDRIISNMKMDLLKAMISEKSLKVLGIHK